MNFHFFVSLKIIKVHFRLYVFILIFSKHGILKYEVEIY